MRLNRPVSRRTVLRRPTLILVATAGLLAGSAVPASADVAPPAAMLSHFETDIAGNTIDRDAGYSARIPGTSRSLWLFGDSSWTGGFWFGTTAAVGPYTAGQVPTGLTEVTTPPAAMSAPSSRPPAGFLPQFPAGLKKPDGTDCNNDGMGTIPASWPTGATAIPGTGRLLVAYYDVCMTSVLTPERFGLVEYDPATNTLSGNTRVFTDLSGLPGQLQLGAPIFSDGHLYLFGSSCDGMVGGACPSGKIYLARTPADAAHWRVSGSYEFWTGSSWSASSAAAGSVLTGARPSSGVYAGDFSAVGKGFVIVETNDIVGGYTIWRSTSLTGGWTKTRTGATPCSDITAEGHNFCRAHIGHPELSTTSNLLMSYYNPADHHLKVTAVPW